MVAELTGGDTELHGTDYGVPFQRLCITSELEKQIGSPVPNWEGESTCYGLSISLPVGLSLSDILMHTSPADPVLSFQTLMPN